MIKKSLLITSDFPPVPGGESVWFYNIFRHLPSSKVVVLAPQLPGAKSFDLKQQFIVHRARGVSYGSILGKATKSINFLIDQFKIYQQDDIELLHCGQAISVGPVGLLFKRLYGIPYFIYFFGHEHESYLNVPFVQKLLRISLEQSDKIIAISEFARRELLNIGLKDEKIVVITPGTDVAKFNPRLDASEIIKKYHLNAKKVILSVSRLVEQKGEDIVIKSLPLVLESEKETVYIIGGTGPYEEQLKELVQKYDLQNNVIFAGYIPDEELPLYYCVCDLFIGNSRKLPGGKVEGFGMVFLEANACAKPVIGGRTGGITDAVVDGKTGILVDALDIEEIANAIIRILNDKEYAEELGREGRKRVEEEYTWERKAKQLEELLTKEKK